MKRMVVFLLLFVLCLSACAKEPVAEPLPPETTAETTVPAEPEPEPELEYVIAEINGVPAVLETLSRGETVDIIEAFDEKHYVVKLDIGYGLVEKNLVRLESALCFQPWTGYAYHNAEVYDNYRLAGEPVKKLASNTEVEVIDDLGWCVLVNYEGITGYMKPETLAKNAQNGGGSSSADSGGTSGMENVGEDGGEISLQFSGKVTLLASIAPQEGDSQGTAKVLADGTDVVLGYFDREDRIPVLKGSAEEGWLTVYLDGLCASISGAYIRTEGEETYAQWEGRSKYNAALYEDFWMLASPSDRLNSNTAVTVLYELENCYLVEVEGLTGYIRKDMVMPAKTESNSGGTGSGNSAQKENSTPVPSQPVAPTTPPDSANSGNPDPEWTPPIL